jgi:carbon monoxide dehydrogenase subunit G
MDGCIRKAVEWCEVQKIYMFESIGVTLKDDVWCWASDLMVVAEVVCGINSVDANGMTYKCFHRM